MKPKTYTFKTYNQNEQNKRGAEFNDIEGRVISLKPV